MVRTGLAALAWAAAAPAAADETLTAAKCWLIFEGFARTPVLSVDAPEGFTASVRENDVTDVIELMALKGAADDHVVRIYELRDGTKFVCHLGRSARRAPVDPRKVFEIPAMLLGWPGASGPIP